MKLIPLSMIDDFMFWISDGLDVLSRFFFWISKGVAWWWVFMIIVALCVAIRFLLSEKARNVILTFLFYVLVMLVAPAVIIYCATKCSSYEKEKDKQIHGIMGSGGDIEDGVFICTGSHSHSYHLYSDCMGLGNCSGEIMKISLEDAQEEGRHLCGFCDKRE